MNWSQQPLSRLLLLALSMRGRSHFPEGIWPLSKAHDAFSSLGDAWLLQGLPLPNPLFIDPSDNAWILGILANPPQPEHLAYLPSHLIQSTLPSTARRSLGEFYTPRWLTEIALHHLRWPAPNQRLIDPTCGAGAFLAAASLALRKQPSSLSENAKRISGADINPLAILGARVACLCAVADLLEPNQPFEPDIRIANLLDPSPFSPHEILVGNPPWIRFSELDPETQKRVATIARHYDIVPPKSFHGGSELDLSAVFSYRMLDLHLAEGGKAALVLPNSLLRSPSSTNFRRFQLPNHHPLALDYILDLGSLRVFPSATNRTALLCWTKGQVSHHTIPADVVQTTRVPPQDASKNQALQSLEPRRLIATFVGETRTLASFPHPPPPSLDGKTNHVQGRKGITTDLNGAFFVRVIESRSNNHLLHVVNNVVQRGKPIPVHEFEVEEELVFPLLKGAKQIRTFHIEEPTHAVIVPNHRVSKIPNETTFQARFPAAHAHFSWIEKETSGALAARSTYRRMFARGRSPFFAIYNVGDYTFAPFKVVWAEIARTLIAGVSTSAALVPGSKAKVIVPDHKVYFAPFQDRESALFLCGLLNSTLIRSYVDAITEKLQVGSLLNRIQLPPYDPKNTNHQGLVELAERSTTHFDRTAQSRIDEIVKRLML